MSARPRYGERSSLLFALGTALGAGLALFLDPRSGRRRRAQVRSRTAHVLRRARQATATAGHDLVHRTRGIGAELRARVRRGPVADDVLVERVRSHLGRVCSHPHAVEVQAHAGTVILGGHVLESERQQVARKARSVRGVREVIERMQTHVLEEHAPMLQGPVRRRGRRFDLLQLSWAPSTRLLMTFTGGLVLASGARVGGGIGTGFGMLGGLLLARALTNVDPRRLLARTRALADLGRDNGRARPATIAGGAELR